jgi:tripartite-type tricarboxylate transporter receptor subunit TctC
MTLKRLLRGALGLALALCLAGAATAQGTVPGSGAAVGNWPNKPVRIIVNFAPGGSTDNAMRPFADRLSRALGQQFVIENKGGASGALGLEAAVKSPADGYTFVATPTLSVTILPNMRKLPFDLFKDLVPVSRFTDGTLLVALHPSIPANSIPDLVAYAKKNPGKLSWGTAGFGSQGHMICEFFKQQAGVDILHVPYRGGGESLSDFLSGVVQLHADANTLPHISAGKGKLLAVLDRQRHPDFPNVPLLKDFYPEINLFAWFGLYAPAGTPEPIIRKLSDEINKIARDPELVTQFQKLALRPNPSSPEELAKTTRHDYEMYGKLARELDLKME